MSPTVKIKRKPLYEITAIVELADGSMLSAKTTTRAANMNELIDGNGNVWDELDVSTDDMERMKLIFDSDPAQITGLTLSVKKVKA